MKIILSPAKKMRVDTDFLLSQTLPVFIDKAELLCQTLKAMPHESLKKLWGCNDAIAEENFRRLESMDLRSGLTPAILSYDGIAYQYMAPSLLEEKQLEYLQEHLRILSGLYGILRPMDGVTPYRLEMQSPLSCNGAKDLYRFWGDSLYQALDAGDGVILNLASKEYSKCITPYLQKSDTFITCIFAEKVKGKMTQKATFAKMARGEMVRYLTEHQITSAEDVKRFDRLNYVYREELSSPAEFVFERCPEPESERK